MADARAFITYGSGQVIWWDVAETTASARGFDARELIELGTRVNWFRKAWRDK